MRPIRIAMVGLRAPWGPEGEAEGGIEQAVAELAPRLARRGCEVTVYCRGRYNALGEGQHHGVRLVNLPTVYGRSTEALLHTALATPLASLKHDLVHLHAAGPASFCLIPRILGRPSIVTLHGKDWERDKWGPAARTWLRAGGWAATHLATHLIAVSKDLEAFAQLGRVPVTHIANGVPDFVPAAWDSSVFPDLVPDEFFLYLGRLVPEKELENLLLAYQDSKSHFKLVIAGGSGYTDGYVERLKALAAPGVVFAGSRYGFAKRLLLSHARAFLFPSRVEGFSIALLEAMASGRAIRASDIAPNREALGTVPLLRVGDRDAWARAIQKLSDQSLTERHQEGQGHRARARQYFTWDAMTDATMGVYRQVLQR